MEGGGGAIYTLSLFWPPYLSKVFFLIETIGICHDKAVSIRDTCFIKTVLLLCEHGHFLLNFVSHGVNSPHHNNIKVKFIRTMTSIRYWSVAALIWSVYGWIASTQLIAFNGI